MVSNYGQARLSVTGAGIEMAVQVGLLFTVGFEKHLLLNNGRMFGKHDWQSCLAEEGNLVKACRQHRREKWDL